MTGLGKLGFLFVFCAFPSSFPFLLFPFLFLFFSCAHAIYATIEQAFLFFVFVSFFSSSFFVCLLFCPARVLDTRL